MPTLGIRESPELGLPVPIFKLDLAETILGRFHNPRLSLGGLAARKGLGGVFVEGVPNLLPPCKWGNLPDNKCWLQAAFRKCQGPEQSVNSSPRGRLMGFMALRSLEEVAIVWISARNVH